MTPPALPKPVLPIEPFAPTPMHLAQIQQAKRLGKKIRNATIIATMGGWFTAIFGAMTLLMSLGDLVGMLLGGAMAVISYFEFRGSKQLKLLDTTAPLRLALNQIAFGALLVAYGGYSLWASMYQPIVPSELANDPLVADIMGGLEGFSRDLYSIVYGGVIAFGILGPGLAALYYYSRKRLLEIYIKETPQWILNLQKAGMTL